MTSRRHYGKMTTLVLLLAILKTIAHKIATDVELGEPKLIRVKIDGTPLILSCPSSAGVGTWYYAPHQNEKYVPPRIIHHGRQLVVVVRGDNELGFYKCAVRYKQRWDYEVVSDRPSRVVVRKRRSAENACRLASDDRVLDRTYYHYETVPIRNGRSATLRCRYDGYDPTIALAANAAVAASSGYEWYWVQKGNRGTTVLAWATRRNLTVGSNYSAEIGHLECRYGTNRTGYFTDRFYVIVQGREPTVLETAKISCFISKHSPLWFHLIGQTTYEYFRTCCTKSTQLCDTCNRGNSERILNVPLYYNGTDRPAIDAFRCGLKKLARGTAFDPACWKIMLTIKHRQEEIIENSDHTTGSSTESSTNPSTLSPSSTKTPTNATSPYSLDATTKSIDYRGLIGGLTATGILLLLVAITVVLTRKRRRQDSTTIWLTTTIDDDNDMSQNDAYSRDVAQIEPPKSWCKVQGVRLKKSYLIPKRNVILLNRLGEGCFGVVMKGTAENVNGVKGLTPVAVKVPKDEDGKSVRDLAAEVNVWTRIGKHRNVIDLVGICVFKGTMGRLLWVVMEYAKHGCLSDYLRAKRFGCLDDDDDDDETLRYVPPDEQTVLSSRDMFRYALDVARGMEHLVLKQCLHRDLAARNVLVCEGEVLKISDFGMAKDIHYFDYYRKKTPKNLVPYKWTAPESLLLRVFDESSDVWSFGVLLWEIATLGSAPYPGVPSETLYDLLTKDGYRMTKPRTCSRNFYNLMLKCWALDPDERPRFHELVSLIETEEHDGEDVERQRNLGRSESDNSRKRQDDSGLPDTPILPTRTFP